MAKLDNRFMPDPAVTSILRGSMAASGTLKLGSTSHATKGLVYVGESLTGLVVDETTNYVGIGTAPSYPLDIAPVSATVAYGARFTWTPTSTVAAQIGLYAKSTYTPGASSGQANTGAKIELVSSGANPTTGQLLALDVVANQGTTSTCSKLYGLRVATNSLGLTTNTITDRKSTRLNSSH